MTANDSQVTQAGTSTTVKADEVSETSIASRGFLNRLRSSRVFYMSRNSKVDRGSRIETAT